MKRREAEKEASRVIDENTVHSKQSSENKHRPEEHPQIPSPYFYVPKTETNVPPSREHQENTKSNQKRWQRHLEYKKYNIEKWGLLAAIFIAFVALYQARQMAIATEASIGASETARRALEDGEDSSVDTLNEMQAQTRAQRQSAYSAMFNLDAIKRQFLQDERPWVKIAPTGMVEVKNGSRIEMITQISVLGKTPALNIMWKGVVEKLDATSSPTFTYPADHVWHDSTGILYPSDTSSVITIYIPMLANPNQALFFTADDVDKWSRGKIYFALHSIAEYKDSFGITHWTKSCFYSVNTTVETAVAARNCSDYNRVDSNNEQNQKYP